MESAWRVTYEVITPESAEEGDVEESGFESEGCTLREALYMVGYGEGGVEASESPVINPRWFTVYKTDQNYQTGAITNKSVHIPESITAASRRRLCKLIGCYGV